MVTINTVKVWLPIRYNDWAGVGTRFATTARERFERSCPVPWRMGRVNCGQTEQSFAVENLERLGWNQKVREDNVVT